MTDARPLEDFGPTDAMVADVFQRDCTSRQLLEAVTGRWGVLTVVGLRDGAVRFNALRRRIDGVSEKMLAQTLQTLERDGVVVREVRATIPPHVEYSLTALGRRVADDLTRLIDVLEGATVEVAASQRAYDARRDA
ncbi:helix-turn-helix transcriptional regulator [Isoptericola sp. NEAU-Y5]|uniref:Helix-turn-helix transcriptional regulator n=1 Tax=Isoptericola luteus TaxID=2879484 RepID=A0ABS7ZBN1_9MICO|nr:helix-turn-helix domain-containing protein [Isoptericola sp. NEAU-Y5]MCA5892454.1 helix-turn-helix transcriptional regulator [Isoptericola sp. NEAU-Y5]